MMKMFNEKENHDLENLNNWYRGYLSRSYQDVNEKVWIKRLESFLCNKDETVDELAKRYRILIDYLKRYQIRMSDAEEVLKFVDALPAEWDDFLKKLKEKGSFSKLFLNGFISKLTTHEYEIEKKKKCLINDIEKNLKEISLDVVVEMKRRVYVCLAAKKCHEI
ncbi:hypothetical protein Hanom_Chr04g00339561 [Helianthus anomalus]